MPEMQFDFGEESPDEESLPPVEPQVIGQSDFGEVQLEGEERFEMLKIMQDRLNEILIRLEHYEEEKRGLPTVYQLLRDPRLDREDVARKLHTLWQETMGQLTIMRSDMVALQKDVKTLDRMLRRDKKKPNG